MINNESRLAFHRIRSRNRDALIYSARLAFLEPEHEYAGAPLAKTAPTQLADCGAPQAVKMGTNRFRNAETK